jgi:hypothetical protein
LKDKSNLVVCVSTECVGEMYGMPVLEYYINSETRFNNKNG